MRANNPNQRSSQRQHLRAPPKSTFREDLVLVKDILEVAWKIAPVSLVPAGLVLWSYLASIQWTGLFYESAMSGTGLVFLVLGAIVMMFLLIAVFVVPSLLIILMSQSLEKAPIAPTEVVRLYRVTLVAWIASLLLLLIDNQLAFWVPVAIPLLCGTFYGLRRLNRLRHPTNGASRGLRAHVKVVGISSLATFSMCGAVFPLIITFNVGSQFQDLRGWQEIGAIIICIIASSIGTLPGFMYLDAKASRRSGVRPFKLAMMGFFTVAYGLAAVASMMAPIQSRFLNAVGIFNNTPTTYQILQPSLADAFEVAGIPIDRAKPTPTATAFVRYRFGATTLVCQAPFTPTETTSESKKLNEQVDPLKQRVVSGAHCVPTAVGELREVRK